jgi:Lon protease-like protein
LPEVLPVFPLHRVILLPRATLTLNVFEPRYLSLVDFALRNSRLIGIVQPAPEAGEGESPEGKTFPLRQVGCAGRVTSFSEADDGRLLISLIGIVRFRLAGEVASGHPFRLFELDYAKYATDFAPGHGEREVDRGRLLAALRNYLAANNLSVDWERIESASNERLVNTLSILSPYGGEEKQALLEAPDLKSRGRALVALAEMELAARDDGSGTQVQ